MNVKCDKCGQEESFKNPPPFHKGCGGEWKRFGVKKMPFNCDVCGNEVSYSERVFKLRNGAEIVICSECLKKKKQ